MQGGRYTWIDGKLTRIEEPTQSHPGGDAPRDEQGVRLDRPGLPEKEPVKAKRKGGSNAA